MVACIALHRRRDPSSVRLTLGEWVSGQDVAKVPVQKQLVITVALLTHQALTVC